MDPEYFEKRLAELEKKEQAVLQPSNNSLQKPVKSILDDIVAEASSLTQDDMEKIMKMNDFQSVDKYVDEELLKFVKENASKQFALTENGKQVYEQYLNVLKDCKSKLEEINKQEREEFEEYMRLKKSGKLKL